VARLAPDVASAVRTVGLVPDDVELVLSRLVAAVPHLEFDENWYHSSRKDEQMEKDDQWAHWDENDAHCHFFVKGSIHIATRVWARAGEIFDEDLELLDCMAKEAARLLDAAGEASISLSDLGIHAVSVVIAKLLRVPSGRIGSYIKFLRSMAAQTYESQKLSYGLILLDTKKRKASAVLEFDNKRFKRLTDGFSTALTLDRNGSIVDIVSLTPSRENKNSSLGRPWWLSALADTSARKGGMGMALTRGGDILVVYGRELLFSQRVGEWRIWRHKSILGAIQDSWRVKGRKGKLERVLAMLYKVALDLSFRRSGGLLVVAESRAKAWKLVSSDNDLIGAESRTDAERALDGRLASANVLTLDRRVLADLASLDGALVIDRTGKLVAYGAMVRSAGNSREQGARTRAAEGASKLGLAIKISSDGGIAVFRKGRKVLSL
jgi:hypothetical protein